MRGSVPNQTPEGLTMKEPLPEHLTAVRDAARLALLPVKAAGTDAKAEESFLFEAKRTEAGRNLPPYYLVFFLLVELLEFRNLGRFEKLAWSIPVELNGRAFLIEHRKFGVGVFAHDPKLEENDAKEIVSRIQKAVRVAEPFFDWLAETAVAASSLNVTNNSVPLFDRFRFLTEDYRRRKQEAHDRRNERIVTRHETATGFSELTKMPAYRLRKESGWMALSAIEAFFSWTEHIFILLAVLLGAAETGAAVARLADADWATKYKTALDLNDPISKSYYDQLISIRRELRNFVAHGAFGKQGEAFHFHSGAGAVPVLLPHRENNKFRFREGVNFDHEAAIDTIDAFIPILWSGVRAPAKIYLTTELPLILTYAANGTYRKAMKSFKEMEELVEHLGSEFDRAANMDW
jgi:hypothetical protein